MTHEELVELAAGHLSTADHICEALDGSIADASMAADRLLALSSLAMLHVELFRALMPAPTEP